MDKTARNTRKTALMRAIKEAATGEVVATIDELTSGLRSLLVADSSTAQLAGALLTPDVCAGLVQGYAFEPCVRAVNHDVSRAAIAHEVNTTGRIPIKRFVDEACVRHHRINHIRVKREKMKPKYAGKDDMTIEDELAPSVEDVQTSIAVIKSSFEGSAQILRDATTDGSDRPALVPEKDLTQFDAHWENVRVAQWLEEVLGGEPGVVALQFPDHLVAHAPSVAARMASLVADSVEIVVLADSAYSGCCVDEVAAEHALAKALVHYGEACLTATLRLPVCYVFCARDVPADEVATLAEATAAAVPDGVRSLVVAYELSLAAPAAAIAAALTAASLASEVVFMDARAPTDDAADVADGDSEGVTYAMGGFSFTLAHKLDASADAVVFVGAGKAADSKLFTALQLNHPGLRFVTVDVDAGTAALCTGSTSRALMKRYMLIEKVKSAEVIGLLVGTLAVGPYLEMLDELRALIEAAGRSYYTFCVGKVNVPKLANFTEVDVFVVVSCPLTALIDSREYIKPLVTPFEAFLALTPGAEWTGEYSTDFEQTLAVIEAADAAADGPTGAAVDGGADADADDDGEHLVTSLSSGSGKASIRAFSIRKKHAKGASSGTAARSSAAASSSDAIISRSEAKRQLAQTDGSGAAAATFAARTWRGIQADGNAADDAEGESNAPAMIEAGRSGRAAKYAAEGSGLAGSE
ncbi:uncharacterized protein AMSG_11863 [Thecamonas trahens ATCC 50062]|uniref:2-(3-amino-3-carboxypropyl)histidine synthase subunit 2 n=1 Tax=Thecamonas trahens ATCC 50062 TaxID=461836 RepID=A0A0L0DA36_THETB|nr:hypothetical protein AMSG_11863 [Thecamonas trahens ATCC 50062]KNC49219.1 hypothetical protein AMSG_11863 [Thecamonas trahens ATCC 50062]|eukprot:XP_013758061.1 hypothetical protein AMSG_11863 [Thecamonas trahens ATCC 50062]